MIIRCDFSGCFHFAGLLFRRGRGLPLRRLNWFRHCHPIIETDVSLVGGETHEYDGAEHEHCRYWNEPAEIEPAGVG